MSGILRKVMVIFAVFFVVLGITISQSFMLAGFLLAALYFVYDVFSQKDYEYTLESDTLTIDVIYGKKYRKTAHVLELRNMEVTAPHWHESVARYKKNGGTEKIKKYDLSFFVALLGKRKNKDSFLLNQDIKKNNFDNLNINITYNENEHKNMNQVIIDFYNTKKELANLIQKRNELELEYKYFNELIRNQHIDIIDIKRCNTNKLKTLWNELM